MAQNDEVKKTLFSEKITSQYEDGWQETVYVELETNALINKDKCTLALSYDDDESITTQFITTQLTPDQMTHLGYVLIKQAFEMAVLSRGIFIEKDDSFEVNSFEVNEEGGPVLTITGRPKSE